MAKRKRLNRSMLLAVLAAVTLTWLILDAQQTKLHQSLEAVSASISS